MGVVSKFKLLVIGSGGREHAIAWTLSRSPHVEHIYVAPGNAGTFWAAAEGKTAASNVAIAADDIPALLAFAQQQQIDLTIVGPELPLAQGIVDTFQAVGKRIFGPTCEAAGLESSKAFAKAFMRDHVIPTANYTAFDDYEFACDYVSGLNRPTVIKADGLAAGKGVIVCSTTEAALKALQRIMLNREFGTAGQTVLVEELLTGPELSVLAFTDGRTLAVMPSARDHKRAYDGDQGPNTGGMGAYAPVQDVDQALLDQIRQTILQPAIDGMAARGTPYVGVLYAGLMLTPDGPKVIEFNCRFGDPETQAILPLLETDLTEIMLACIEGKLDQSEIRWRSEMCATVVLAAPGYPEAYPKGLPITGLDKLPSSAEQVVFHAGTARQGEQIVTAGGRVFAVSALGIDLAAARTRAYETIGHIHFDGMHYRRDIGQPPTTANADAYIRAGVNIDAAMRATEMMAAGVKSTYGPEVLAGIGAFGGLYDANKLKAMAGPVLVASTDGVGTKTKVAARVGRWDTIGIDLVNHCVNDILVQGARPLFFLDYVASSHLEPEQIATIVNSVSAGCRQVGCALLGGETAEMPDVYQPGEVDLVGTIIGTVEREQIIDGSRIRPGDVILGLPSSGLHTNGYSLARKILDTQDWLTPRPELGCPLADILLVPHRCYLEPVARLWAANVEVRGLAHITGGGLIDNPPRIFPAGVGAVIQRGTWPELPIFGLIQRLGNVSDAEMFRVFNMGLGMLVIIPSEQVAVAQQTLPNDLYIVGEIVNGQSGVTIRDR